MTKAQIQIKKNSKIVIISKLIKVVIFYCPPYKIVLKIIIAMNMQKTAKQNGLVTVAGMVLNQYLVKIIPSSL